MKRKNKYFIVTVGIITFIAGILMIILNIGMFYFIDEKTILLMLKIIRIILYVELLLLILWYFIYQYGKK